MIAFYQKQYNQLTKDELYEILRLRAEVFVVEQNCVYQDIDNKDQKALHILGIKKGSIVAYARVFKPKDYFEYASIGRIVIHPKERNNKYGYELVETAIKAINLHFKSYTVAISAQKHLEKFYNNLGFKKEGKSYLEDGIPHIYMIKS
jgi:ElaA protein